MIPTKRFCWLMAAGIPIAALAASGGIWWFIPVYNALLFGAAWITYRMGPKPENLRLSRSYDAVLSVRVPNRIRVKIENDGFEAIKGRFRDEVPETFDSTQVEFPISLPAGESLERTYDVMPPERGSEKFKGTFFRLLCPLGLAEKQFFLDTSEEVRVYPNVLALRDFDLLKQQGRLKEVGQRQAKLRGLGTEFESLRDYATGDDYRKIDWKASARRGKMVVRQFEQERNQCVFIVIDIGRHMLAEVNGVRKLDHVLDALLMLTHSAAMAGDLVGVLVYSDQVKRYLPPRKGRQQVNLVIDAIHDLVAEPVESDPVAAFEYLRSRWNRRSLVLHFTDYEDPDRAVSLAHSLAALNKKHLLLQVRVTDPHLQTMIALPTANEVNLYEKAGAQWVLADRKVAGKRLSQYNIRQLESEPQNLANALVNYYLDVKGRALL